MLVKIKQLYRYICIALTLAIFIPFLYIFRPKNKAVRQLMCRTVIFLLGIKIKLEGSLDTEAKLLILNHQSMLDIISLESIHPLDLCWISKKEITDYPYYGHINKAPRMISVDREDKAGLVKLIADVKDRLENNRPVVIFPEGTRGKEAQMLEFKPGGKLIAEKFGLKVQPIVIVDSAGFLSSKHFSLKNIGQLRSGELKIIALDSFVPARGSDWFNTTRDSIQHRLDEERAKA